MVLPDPVSLSLLAGIGFFVAALAPVSRLFRLTRSRELRRAWGVLSLMILGFAAGYAFLIAALPRDIDPLLLTVIKTILVMGAVFVFSVGYLSAQTASDVARVAELERDVIVDPLTGIHNRRYFDERLAEEIARAGRIGRPLSLILADLDRFKAVNDRYGHAAGDHVLAVAAARLSEVTRASDVLARFGGEEFVVLVPHTGAGEAVRLAERMRRTLREASPTVPGAGALRVTASFGVATYLPGEGRAAFFARSDAALYAAKAAGRDRVVAADGLPGAAWAADGMGDLPAGGPVQAGAPGS